MPRLALTTARVLAWLGYTPPRVYVGIRRRMARRLRLATARARGGGIGSHAGIRAPARIHGVAEVHPCWGALGRGPEAYQSRDVRRSVIYNTRKHATVLYCTAACHGPPLPEARPEPLAIWVGQFYSRLSRHGGSDWTDSVHRGGKAPVTIWCSYVTPLGDK